MLSSKTTFTTVYHDMCDIRKWYLSLTKISRMYTPISWAIVSLNYSIFSYWFGSFIMLYDDDDNYMHVHFEEKPHEFWTNSS